MLVYRLTKGKYKDKLSGKGAAIMGGRWNSPGTEIIYTATNRALAMSEVAVHVSFELLKDNYYMMEVELPDDFLEVLSSSLPEEWNSFPYNESTRHIGDTFVIDNKALALRVPSAVVQGEWNVMINPRHKKFTKVKIKTVVPFRLDRRLF